MIRPTHLALAALLCACAAPRPARPDSGWQDLPDGVRPTLEEVFLEPPISGDPPRASSLSPDGRWLLLRWGSPAEAGEDPPLRLLDLDDPAASNYHGVPLAELVPKLGGLGDEEELGPVEWAQHGARLAIARGPDLFVLDPASEWTGGLRVAPLLLPPLADDEKDEEDQENEEETEGVEVPPPDVLPGRVLHDAIKSLRFGPEDRTLRFADAEELYELPLPERGLPAEPSALEDATLWSEVIDPMPLRAQWSRDLGVVLSIDPPLVEEPEPEEGVEAELDVPHVYRLGENRFVTLEGVGTTKIEKLSLSYDGRFAAGAEYDRETEPEPTLVPNYLSERVSTKKARRLLADDGPSPFRLWMWNTSTGERSLIFPKDADGVPLLAALDPPDVEGEAEGQAEASSDGPSGTGDEAAEPEEAAEPSPRREGEHLLRTIGWAPSLESGGPARFAYELLSADYRELEIWCWTEGFCERLWFERDERWIGGPARYARWTDDGSRLLVGSEAYADSTTPGRCQVFSIDPDSKQVLQLTEVAGEVRRFRTTDEGTLVYEASEDDLARSVLGWLPAVQVGGQFRPEPRSFPVPPGWNSSYLTSSDGERIVFAHESLLRPAELWVADREVSRQVTRTTPETFEQVDWIAPERLGLEAPDGRTVWAHVFVPPDAGLEPADNPAPRATIVFVHGAGYLQNVTDSMTRYPLNLMFHSRLAQLGYPVIDVDYRGSAGYGHDFRTDVQYHLGGTDLDDIHLVVDELVARGLVDPERIGIYGGSYGGFMAMMALFTAPERWSVGAALRSVTDWRTYNPWYTQPRLGRPSTHAEAYALSSPIDHVEDVQDPLLILHGMQDSNVFAQDSIRLIEALIDQGSDFDAMLYPSQGHGFEDGPHWLDEYRRIERYLLLHLGPPLGEADLETTEGKE